MKVVLNMKGFAALRSDPAMMDELNRLAEEIATRAGDGFEAKPAAVTGGRGRGRAAVITMTPQARVDNAKHNTLLHALGGSE
jgi:hypothetical protein